MNSKKRIFRIPIFVPHKGCPHDCVFCNQKKITGHTDQCTPQSVAAITDEYIKSILKKCKREDAYIEIAYFGGSFTGIEFELQKQYMQAANKYLMQGKIDGIRCSTRPDYIDDNILCMLKQYGITTIELGVQTTDSECLKLSNRGHSFEDVKNASELIKNHGINLGLQMMTGLPGDTPQKSLKTADDIIALNPQCVRIYPTLVMEGTHLYTMYKKGEYKPFTLEQTVCLCAQLAEKFNNSNIEIIRIGLQTTDEINKDTVIGPYHPALAELCYGRLERNKIEKYIIENNLKNVRLKIESPKQNFSQIIGHSKENCIYFKNKYNIDIKLCQSEQFKISIIDY